MKVSDGAFWLPLLSELELIWMQRHYAAIVTQKLYVWSAEKLSSLYL